MLADLAVSPYVLAGDGSSSEACLVFVAVAVDESWEVSALDLSGVAGEPAIATCSNEAIGGTVAGMLCIKVNEGARAWNKMSRRFTWSTSFGEKYDGGDRKSRRG